MVVRYVSLMSFEGWQLPRECFGETVRIDCSWSLWLCGSPTGDSKLFQISLTVLFFLVQMAASSRKEERIPTPSVPMEKIQMRPKCDFSWSGSCKEIEHPLPKSKLRPWRKVMEFSSREAVNQSKCPSSVQRAKFSQGPCTEAWKGFPFSFFLFRASLLVYVFSFFFSCTSNSRWKIWLLIKKNDDLANSG